MDIVGLLTSFQGRINRGKYWLAVLIYFIAAVIVAIIGGATREGTLFQILNIAVSIASFVSGLAVGIKRLHDRDKSGWWLLLFYIAPGALIVTAIISGVVSLSLGGVGGNAMLLLLAAFAILIWGFVELGCLRGTVGPNHYGPDPLAGQT